MAAGRITTGYTFQAKEVVTAKKLNKAVNDACINLTDITDRLDDIESDLVFLDGRVTSLETGALVPKRAIAGRSATASVVVSLVDNISDLILIKGNFGTNFNYSGGSITSGSVSGAFTFAKVGGNWTASGEGATHVPDSAANSTDSATGTTSLTIACVTNGVTITTIISISGTDITAAISTSGGGSIDSREVSLEAFTAGTLV